MYFAGKNGSYFHGPNCLVRRQINAENTYTFS